MMKNGYKEGNPVGKALEPLTTVICDLEIDE